MVDYGNFESSHQRGPGQTPGGGYVAKHPDNGSGVKTPEAEQFFFSDDYEVASNFEHILNVMRFV